LPLGLRLLEHRGSDERHAVSLVQSVEHLRDIVVADAERDDARLEGAGGLLDEHEPRVRGRVADRELLTAGAEGGPARAAVGAAPGHHAGARRAWIDLEALIHLLHLLARLERLERAVADALADRAEGVARVG